MRFRWLLPACNISIDVVLFVILVHAVDVYRSVEKHPPPLWRQEYQHADVGLLSEGCVLASLTSEGCAPAPLMTIIAGTAPAALIASIPLNNGWYMSWPFDVRWASLFLVLASVLWYAIGRWAETGHPQGARFARIYVLLRALSVPLSMSWLGSVWTTLSQLLLFSVWFAVASYVILRTASFLYRRVRSRIVQAA